MTNVIAYGSIFAAVGCKLQFSTVSAHLEVVDSPKQIRKIVDAALHDIEKFELTANFTDGLAAPFLADDIDGESNPINKVLCIQALTTLGLMRDGKFISQVLALQKTNRSWHTSEQPNSCSYFGEECTNRSTANQGKRGRKSTRNPDQYHPRSSTGIIGREQLVTQNLEKLFSAIPAQMLVSSNTRVIDLASLDDAALNELLQKIKIIQQEKANV